MEAMEAQIKVPFTAGAYLDKKIVSHFIDETESFLLYDKAKMIVGRSNFLIVNIEITNG